MTGTVKGIGSGAAASLAKPINEQNKGGFFAGLSYLLEKAGLGFVGALEGLVDYTVGGIAELTGNHDYAESVIANDWLDYSHADEWFVPDDRWKLAGDVAAGIGNSVPGLAANIGVGIATGGMSVVAQAALAGTTTFLTSGLSAAGNSVKDAYRETGKLGAEEWAYGTGAGALEGTVEALGDTVFGLGFGAAKKAASGIFGKNTAKTIAREGIFKTMAKGFAGEAGEEMISAIFEPYIKRATYDPNAKDASLQEIAYSALVGGLSGMLMSGAAGGANALVNVKHGADIENRGETQRILDRSEQIAKAETSVKTESDAFRAVDGALREFKASVETHPSDTLTMKQKMLLGYLDRANTVAAFQPYFWKEATNILSNAEGVAEAINRFYSDSTSGEKIHITAQELLKDIDMSSPQAYRKSIVKALKTNQKLRTLTVLRATGRLTMNTEKYTDALLAGENIAVSQEGLKTFLKHAKPHQLKSFADALGIDDLSSETTETLLARIGEYRERVGEDYYKASEHAVQAFSSVGEEDARGKLPHMVRGKNDGVRRYRIGDNDIGILQEGKEYRFYDYNEKGLSRPMKYSEAQKVLTAWREEAENSERRNVTGRARENSFTREAVPAGARFAIKRPAFSEEAISNNVETLAKMDPVATVDAKKLEKSGKRPSELFDEFFASLGNHIDSDLFGDIALPKSSVKSEIRHGLTAEKIASIEAIPAVIRDGKVIFSETKTNSDVERIVVAAPIKIGQAEYYMGVMLQRDTQTQRLYLHNVVAIKEEAITSSQDGSLTNWSDENDSHLFITSILQKAVNVKLKMKTESSVREAVPGGARATLLHGARYAIKYPSFSDAEISSNMETIAKMEAVATVDANKLEKTGKSPMDIFNEYFNSLGNNIASETFGDIALSKSSAKSEIRHGITAEKIASIEAIPAVIEQGKVIFQKVKEGGVERIVVCAPIKIGNAEYYMGVMLQRDARYQRLYLHNTMSVAIEKEATSSSKDNLVTTGALQDENHLSITSIIQKALDVKLKMKAESVNIKRGDRTFAEEVSAPIATASDNRISENSEKSNPSAEKNSKNMQKQGTTRQNTSKDAIATFIRMRAEAEKFAIKHVPEYGRLNAPDRLAVETTIRQAMAANLSEEIVTLSARVAAHSGLTVVFLPGIPEDGMNIGNTVYLSPWASETRLRGKLLIHELDHILVRQKNGNRLIAEALKNIDPEKRKEVIKQYKDSGVYDHLSAEEKKNALEDEVASAYAEEIASDPKIWDYILSEKPTAKERVLSFFRRAARDYAFDEKMSAEAKRYLKQFKQLFDTLSEQNATYGGATLGGARFALSDTVEEDVVDRYGKTYRWSETGYILKDGTRLDLSGRKDGAPGGYRTMDHRDIFEDISEGSGTNAMIEFMSRGNIRVSPEMPGINLQTEPTAKQYEQIADLVERLGWKEKSFLVDFDNKNGETVDTLDYEGNVSARKVVSDIQYYFKEGKTPQVSNLAKFRYALSENSESASRYTYDALIAKKDMKVTALPKTVPTTEDGKIDRKAIVALGRMNARSQKNPHNTDTSVYVYVDDIGRDVLIGTKGLQHGLVRSEETALAVMKIGDILKNSIAVNEMNGSATRKTEMSYTLLGMCQSGETTLVVRSVISKLSNDVTEFDVYQLEAVKGKKTEIPNSALKRGAAVTEQSSLISSGSRTISISDFLEKVKALPLANEIFSQDVSQKLGIKRSVGTLSDSIRFALSENGENASRYTYDALIAKKDMKVTALPKTVPTTEDGKIDRKAIVALGRMNARSQKNPHNTDTSVYVYVDDIGRDVLLSKEGMQHGIARSKESALAVTRIGDVLKSSIAVNELNGSTTRKTEMSYVLLGACRDGENLYVVRSVVSRIENDVTEIDVYRLGAVKSKKTETPTPALGGTAVTEQSSLISSESPAISISDFLEKVKTLPLANEIFSQDVLKKLGIKRSVGTLSDSIRFALPEDGENASRYTYDALIQKKDMIVTELKHPLPRKDDGKISRSAVRMIALANVKKQNNPMNTEDFVYAHCNDTDTDIRVGTSGINHGLDRRAEVNGKAAIVIGDLIKNAVKVNEVYGNGSKESDDYVLYSVFQEDTGTGDEKALYGVSIYVNRESNDVSGYDSVDIMYSENGKKIGTAAPSAERSYKKPLRSTVPTISIAELLEKSNTFFKDIFSEDVYAHFDTQKDKGTKLGATTRYALPENSDAYSDEDTNALANYSKKEYNHFGWARAAEALSYAELDDLYAKIQARSSLYTFRRSKNGESIIEVNNKPHTTLDVDNVFVFVKGTTKNFTITRVVRFDVQTETEMDSIRRTLYEGRTWSDSYCSFLSEQGFAKEYRREDSELFEQFQQKVRRGRNGQESGRIDRNHRRSEKYRSGYYLHIGEDGEITETFGNKNKVTRRLALPEDGEFTFSEGEDGALHVSRNLMSFADDPAHVRQATDISREKYYSKKELEAAVNSAVDEIVQFNDEHSSLKGKLKGKTKRAVVNYLWQKFNKSASEEDLRKSAVDIADYIIDHTMVEEIYNDARYTDNDIEHAEAALTVLRGFMHNMNLQALRGEIKYKYDKKANGVFLTWGKKEGGITADVAVMALRDAGLQIEVADAEADCFFNILDLYERSREILRDKAFSEKLKAFGSEEEIAAMRDEIAKKILSIRDLEGKKTQYGKLVEEYTEKVRSLKQKSEDTIHSLKRDNAEKVRSLKQELRDERQIPPLENRVIKKVQGVKDWKSGVFQNATQYRPKILLQTIGKLSSVAANGNIRDGAVRKVMRDLYLWYSSENTRNMLEGTGRYNAEVAGMLSALAEDARPLTAAEENDLAGVLTLYRQVTGVNLEGTPKKEAAATLRDFYTRKNIGDAYSAETKQLLSRMAKDSTLTAAELRELGDVVDYFKHFVENFNRVFRDGKWQDAAPIAEEMIHIAETAETANYGIFYRLMRSKSMSKYRETFAEPLTVAKYADGHDDNGFYTRVVTALREAAVKASVIERDLRQRLEEFYGKKENRKWLKRAQKETVTYNNETLTKREAIQLYMTFHRDIATAGLLLSGFDIRRDSGTLTVKPIADASLTAEQLETLTKKCIADLKAQFSTSDLEFISIAEEIYKDCRELKRETDMLRNGFSNVTEGYYVPVERIGGAKSFDSDFFGEGVSVNRQSFNKSTVKGAKAKLVISPVDEVLSRHIEGIARYAAFGPVLDTMDMLWNFDIGGNPNNPTSMRTVAAKSWRGGEKYLTKLKQDCKGIGRDGKLPFVQKLIGKYATAALALNPKVLASQLSSLIASTSILDYTSLLRGITMSGKDVDVYCKLAQVRNYDKTAYRAQAVTDKIGSVGEVLMEPIGKVDRFVVKKLFGACQVQVEKEGGAKIGTVENKQAAGKLLERVILETQQNAYATERSEAMRSGNDFLRITTLFSADSMKVFDRILDSWGEWSVLSAKIKAETDPKVLAELKARRKQTRKHFAKAAGALLASGIYMALVAEFFRWFFGQRDEDDDLVVDLVHGTIGNLFGGLPLIRDVMSFITDGYEMSAPTYDMINNAMDATKTAVTVMPKIIDGTAEKQEAAKATRNFIYAASQLLGVPTKNAYKLFYGVTSKVSKKAGYVLDDLFYRQNYRRDLAEAIMNEDDEMTDLLLSMIARDSTGTDAGTEWKGATGALLKSRSRRMAEDEMKAGTDAKSAVSKVMKDLLNAGQNPLPRSIGDTITHDGDEYELTKENKALFKKIYGESSEVLERMVTTPAFAALDTEEKASAIRYVYDTYDRKAKESVLDTEADVRTIAAKMTDVGTLALVKAKISSFEAERDKNGKVIGGTKKKKVLRYLSSLGLSVGEALFLLYLNGYAIGDGEIRGMSETTAKKKLLRYIQSSNLTSEERVAVAEACGFTVKGGKVLLPAS